MRARACKTRAPMSCICICELGVRLSHLAPNLIKATTLAAAGSFSARFVLMDRCVFNGPHCIQWTTLYSKNRYIF